VILDSRDYLCMHNFYFLPLLPIKCAGRGGIREVELEEVELEEVELEEVAFKKVEFEV